MVVVLSSPASTSRLVETSGATAATEVELGDGVASSRVSVDDCPGRRHRQQVRAEAVEPVRDVRGRALADADEGDDRGDADDHAEHRQRGAEPARAQAREGQAEEFARAHAAIQSVAQVDLPAGGLGDLGVVGDEDDGPARGVELAEQREDLGAGVAVEVARGLVREDRAPAR